MKQMKALLAGASALLIAVIAAAAPCTLTAQTAAPAAPPFTYSTSFDSVRQTWRVVIVNPGTTQLKCAIAYSTSDTQDHPQSGTRLVIVPSPAQVPGSPASGLPYPVYFDGFINLTATVTCVSQ